MPRRPLYIESVIDAGIDELWEKSQDPGLHQRWDLRFSEIDYLPTDPGDPQRFTYASRLGGLRVGGTGESTGERYRPDGSRSSFLKFWSDHPLALIESGSGYWRYVPTERGVRFYTGYDYDVRWGWLGRLVDRVLFRPWMGWATAWSFDRLRLWLEMGISPETSLATSVAHFAARVGLGSMWVYQGLVPKLLAPVGEIALIDQTGLPGPEIVVTVLGVAQIGFGLIILLVPRWRWPYLVTALAMVPLTLAVLSIDPGVFVEPFNPLAMNLLAAALGVAGFVTWPNRPSARRCLRRPSTEADVDL
jgi:uncharacterized membrane protein YphA (DoxX/SURF4 family)